MMQHYPVLLKEVIEYLEVQADDIVVDATFGFGGHTKAISERIKGGKIIAIEQDEEVLAKVDDELLKKITPACDNFVNLSEILEKLKIKKVSKILFDLGVSTYHFKGSGRGFSFGADEPLDMRLGEGTEVTAADLVNGSSQVELADLFYRLGDEFDSRKIAKAIFERRKSEKITTSAQLAQIVEAAKGHRGKIHPATKVFQALRIAVNCELENLEKVLPQAINCLEKGGRLAVISFHSGEDRIVKNVFKRFANNGKITLLTKKPVVATREENRSNPPSRSAKLRVAEKL